MKRKREQFLAGQQRIFEHNPELKNAAIFVLKRLASNADTKSITLPDGDYADYNNLFLNCNFYHNSSPFLFPRLK